MKKVQNFQGYGWGKAGIVLPLLAGIFLLAGCQNSNKWSDKSRSETVVTSSSSSTTVTPVPAPTPRSTQTAQSAPAPMPAPAPAPMPEPVSSPAERGRIGLCQSELASLQKISPKTYAAKKASFDNLIRSASVYTAVRGDINAQTKDTMDALYKYKTNQMCSEIERAVMDGLIRRGESVK
ncbi:hypothetical protein C8D90_105367 [Enterobacillus tribolii]|uniref:Lipoprotein n=1 Tax=Enterobacillus tribolii TaxID=1487935 RepID=A0A370QQR3_9GAMM|nr:hypothetical protein C8D90_105367 [Enterobacillus tribolii]